MGLNVARKTTILILQYGSGITPETLVTLPAGSTLLYSHEGMEPQYVTDVYEVETGKTITITGEDMFGYVLYFNGYKVDGTSGQEQFSFKTFGQQIELVFKT